MSTELTKREPGDVAIAQPTMLQIVMSAASDPAIDPARLRELLAIGKELEADKAKRLFGIAWGEMQQHLPVVQKRGQIMFTKSAGPKYAKWEDVHRACMPVLRDHGFGVSFDTRLDGNALTVIVVITHSSGHEERRSCTVPWLDTGGSKSPAQQAVSSETLAMRHAFIRAFNIRTEDEDDDGSGKGVAERITEDQAARIEDMLTECENRDHGMRGRFGKWLASEFRTGKIADLFQGDQHDAVVSRLREKLKALGTK
jgi:hypothetical protein